MVTGVVRRLDNLGRITLPMEFRETLGISENQKIEICLEGDSIRLKPYIPHCIKCNCNNENFVVINGDHVCPSCAKEILDKLQEVKHGTSIA